MHGTFWVGESQLDAEQSSAVQSMGQSDSFLIRGPAGSGKTNILLLRAKWFKLKDIHEFKIIVFTSSLKRFIQEGCSGYGISPEYVTTGMQFFKMLLDEYHIKLDLTGDFETDRAMVAGRVQSLVDEKGIKPIYEALLVDECQDYMDTELMVMRKLCERLILVADSRQSIYKSTHTPDLLESLVEGKIITLKYHYRSGLNICRVADSILKDSASFAPVHGECRYDEASQPSSVVPVPTNSFSEQISSILSKLKGQVDLYPDELIGVLFPKREQLDKFTASLAIAGTEFDTGRIRPETMHSAKGLEFRAVHIAGCEALYKMGSIQKRLAYTAVLRGRTSVHVYYTGNMPGYFESAIARLAAPKPNPVMSDLFRK